VNIPTTDIKHTIVAKAPPISASAFNNPRAMLIDVLSTTGRLDLMRENVTTTPTNAIPVSSGWVTRRIAL
jgi:hypothetical protein